MDRRQEHLVTTLRAQRAWLHADCEATNGRPLDYVPLLLALMECEADVLGLCERPARSPRHRWQSWRQPRRWWEFRRR